MKLSKQTENDFFGRYEENEDLMEALLKFCGQNNIQTGYFSIIGAVKEVSISFYDQKTKKYLQMDLEEEAEILNCTGDIALKDGKPIIHAHITLGGRDGRAFGGHLVSGKVFGAEIYLRKFDKVINRKPDKSTGLNLLEP